MAHGVTTEMQAQFAELRREQRCAVAERVLAIVGTRQPRNADLVAHDAELRGLLGHVRAFWTCNERQRLYKSAEHVGASLARLVLTTEGYPLGPSPGR
jgi:hypothetical protein